MAAGATITARAAASRAVQAHEDAVKARAAANAAGNDADEYRVDPFAP